MLNTIIKVKEGHHEILEGIIYMYNQLELEENINDVVTPEKLTWVHFP